MALLTDKETKKNLSERLEEFLQFGMVFNYMLETEKIELKDLEKMFLDTDQEKATFAYTYLLGKVAPNDIESSYALYSYKYPNDRGLDTDKYNSYLNSSCIRNILKQSPVICTISFNWSISFFILFTTTHNSCTI